MREAGSPVERAGKNVELTIPRNGYRLEDFVDDDMGGETEDAPRGGFCTTAAQPAFDRSEVREPAAVYRLSAA